MGYTLPLICKSRYHTAALEFPLCGVAVVLSITSPLGLPAPIFWGAIVAWIPIPPAIMVGVFCATMAYALMVYLFSLGDWHEQVQPPIYAEPTEQQLYEESLL